MAVNHFTFLGVLRFRNRESVLMVYWPDYSLEAVRWRTTRAMLAVSSSENLSIRQWLQAAPRRVRLTSKGINPQHGINKFFWMVAR